jgi:GR25 family glycosyltransferase involved in LPS biosynthesis
MKSGVKAIKNKPWHDAFDRIVMITLRGPDGDRRRRSSMPELARAGIPAPRIELFFADRHPEGGRKGCFHSHMAVLGASFLGKNSENETLLVFEDDVRIAPGFRFDVLDQASSFIRNKAFDMFLLGFAPRKPLEFLVSQAVDRNIVRYGHPALTHAVTYSRRGAERILGPAQEHYRTHDGNSIEHFDIFLHRLALETFCAVPIQFDQIWCMGTNNVPNSRVEGIARKMTCALDYTNALSIVAVARGNLYATSLLLVTLAVLVGWLTSRLTTVTLKTLKP